MATPQWIRRMLEVRGIPYEELHHAEVYTARELAQQEHSAGQGVAKVVVVIADGKFVELVLPASRQVALERLRAVLPARNVRLASEEEMAEVFLGCERGAIPPLREWPAVSVLMDPSLRLAGDVVFQAGTHTDAIRLRFEDWFKMVQPRVESFSAPAVPLSI